MQSKISRRVLARTIAERLLQEPQHTRLWLQRVAAYLIEHNRIQEVDLLVGDIAHELFAQGGQLLVDVTSARALSDTVKSELTQLLKEATGAKHVGISKRVDPDLLGGLVARTPDAVLDLSIRTKLKQLATIN